MRNAFITDILRTIKKNSKRFTAILSITVLGIVVFTGIYAACQDMYLAADRFYDEQQLFDIRILSTLGITDEDVQVLSEQQAVHRAEGGYSETVDTTVAGATKSAELTMLSRQGLNQPYLVEGTLPVQSGEMAVTEKYLSESGLAIGDAVKIVETIEEDDEEDEVSDESDEDDEEDDLDLEIEVETEDEQPNFRRTEYTITGVVIDPMDVASSDGTVAFRSNNSTDYTFFITAADIDSDIYTAVYLMLEGTEELECYSEAYETKVGGVIDQIENGIMKQRQQKRYDEVMGEALEKISDAEALMSEKFAEADQEFADAWADIEKAKQELVDGEAKLTEEEKKALAELAKARQELKDGKAKLNKAEEQLKAGEKELTANAKKIKDGKDELAKQRKSAEAGFAEAAKAFAENQSKLDESRGQLQGGIDQLKASFGEYWPEQQWSAFISSGSKADQDALSGALRAILSNNPGADVEAVVGQCIEAGSGWKAIVDGQQELTEQKQTFEQQKKEALGQLDDAQKELDAGDAAIAAGRSEMAAGRKELEQGKKEMAAGEARLNKEEKDALRQLAEAWQELAEGKEELADGETELQENEKKYQDKQKEAQEKLDDAYAELDDIDMTKWYVQDRMTIDSYSSLDSDLGSINSIGNTFPILFLIVAILISLTTMTRMVEEERGIIGAYKALGYGNGAIGFKYMGYALLASVAGGIIGNVLGFVVMPKLLMLVLERMYIIPGAALHFDIGRGLIAILLFAVSIGAATALTCRNELRQTPAALMRPKAPRAGSRIFLERLTPIWKHLRFLNKVTARNLFRYKKRLAMTVFGIAGCTALVLVGFAIRDSITELIPMQYEDIYSYDMMLAADPEDNDDLVELLATEDGIADELSMRVETGKVMNMQEESESVQIISIPEGEAFDSYLKLYDLKGDAQVFSDQGVFITENAADLLGIESGDQIMLQDLELTRCKATVTEVVENYIGNNIYMSQSLYESLFGEYKMNGAYVHLDSHITDQPAYAEGLLDNEFIMSAVSVEALKESFVTDFAILNAVIYGLIVLAAGLAFVVLFTLSNTNISERVRELATIKVLGFYDPEVHSYINKETLLLTLIGVLVGLPLGYVLSGALLGLLKMPSLQFSLTVQPVSYLIAGVISFSFALVVNLITNRTLNKINMVEALKSVE